jgi:tRNA pseudouridine synthase 10
MKKTVEATARKILSLGYVCDNCLGRQFSKLMKGETNAAKGKIIRRCLEEKILPGQADADQINFRNHEKAAKKGKIKCIICENLFSSLPLIVKKIIGDLKKIDFKTFMVGVRMSDPLAMNEELLWEKIGVKYSEPIKADIGRTIAKAIAEKTDKKPEQGKPDIIIIFDVQRNATEIFSNPLFIYGEYKKFSRGLPQTSSPLYKESVQDIIAKPFMKITKSSSHVLHAMGREDKEARCLAWRPFVLEIKQPMSRRPDLKSIKNQINKSSKIKVSSLRYSGRKEIAEIKSKKPYKIYRVVVDFEMPVEDVEKVKKIVGIIKQKTPFRVLGRKEDRTKHKKVKSIRWKRINTKRYQFEITAESGLYLNELVSGDAGRTRPSVSQILGNHARLKQFDLIGLED